MVLQVYQQNLTQSRKERQGSSLRTLRLCVIESRFSRKNSRDGFIFIIPMFSNLKSEISNPESSILLRPAVAADQPAIRTIIRITGINPMRLDWPRFLVAEQSGQVIGVGQVKPHGDGSRELASIAVRPEYQGLGIGTAIVRALLARESGEVYLFCLAERVSFYQRLGFVVMERTALPPMLRRMHRLSNWLGYLPRLLGRSRVHVMAMKIVIAK